MLCRCNACVCAWSFGSNFSVEREASLAFYEGLVLHSTAEGSRQALALHSVTSHMLKETRPEALEGTAVHEAIVSACQEVCFVLALAVTQ